MPRILSFQAAISDANKRCDDISILLGNGFSIDYDPALFSYESLADEARLDGLSISKDDLFRTLESSNFEIIVDKLQSAAKLQLAYGADAGLADTMNHDAEIVRHGLAEVIAARHPGSAQELTEEEVAHAKTFLAHFRRIYTLSYDLLLYWVLNREDVRPYIVKRDGFEFPTARDRTALIWKSNPTQGSQRIFNLHGALHYFTKKVTVDGKKQRRLRKLAVPGRLVATLQERLNRGQYPLIVTEGTRAEKDVRIEKSAYLRTSLRRFGEVEGALFVHGASLSRNDDHVWELIESDGSDVECMYVGLHDPDGSTAQDIIDRAKKMRKQRAKNGGRVFRLRFYDAATASVWRDEA